jgi:hypothetical protein
MITTYCDAGGPLKYSPLSLLKAISAKICTCLLHHGRLSVIVLWRRCMCHAPRHAVTDDLTLSILLLQIKQRNARHKLDGASQTL